MGSRIVTKSPSDGGMGVIPSGVGLPGRSPWLPGVGRTVAVPCSLKLLFTCAVLPSILKNMDQR